METDDDGFLAALKNNMPPIRSKFDWPKVVNHIKRAAGPSVVATHEGGSNSKHFFMFNRLIVRRDRPFNSWNENCLFGRNFLISLLPTNVQCQYSCYGIGEHAISRIFLRKKSVLMDGVLGSDFVYSELVHVPLWSDFWFQLAFEDSLLLDGEAIYPVIPSPSGLFLCQLKKGVGILEIRTFISNSQLSDEQAYVKKALDEVTSLMKNSPILPLDEGAPELEVSQQIIRCILSKFLFDGGRVPEVLRLFFKNFDSDSRRIFVRNSIESKIKNKASVVEDVVTEMYVKKGARKFFTIQKNIFKSKNNHL